MRFVALFIALCVSVGAWAQGGWPAKPIRIVVPVTTGGPSDLVARILGEKLSASLGKPVIIENRPGASMVIGSAFVAKSTRCCRRRRTWRSILISCRTSRST
jgi:tripartite-type tricarboxylate transporter receptor subunit TctC